MNEQVVHFGTDASLVGVLTRPDAGTTGKGRALILLNSGILHRVGPNRVYVHIARALADAGWVAFRFDFSGIGDSETRTDTTSFAARTFEETQAAMNCVTAMTGVREFVLAGICSGAHSAVNTGTGDARTIGVISINHAAHRGAGGRDFARTILRHYRRLVFASSFGPKTWIKALRGEINIRRVAETFRALFTTRPAVTADGFGEESPFVKNRHVLARRGVGVLLVHSEGDEGLDYTTLILRRALGMPSAFHPAVKVIHGANHTFTLRMNQQELIAAICEWADRLHSTTPTAMAVSADHPPANAETSSNELRHARRKPRTGIASRVRSHAVWHIPLGFF
jgi:hypothetical protein